MGRLLSLVYYEPRNIYTQWSPAAASAIENRGLFYDRNLKMATNAGMEDVKEVPSTSKAREAGVNGYSSSASINQGIVHIRTKNLNDCAFDSTEDPRYYKPIPTYEGIHRWDPDFEWTEDEEKRVTKKVI